MTSKRPRPGWARLAYALALVAILLFAAFLRFYRLDASSLWSDEGNSWAMLSRSLGEIANAAAADIHPPGYYWLLKGWSLLFGDSAWAMRSFSAVAGVLLVAVIERIGGRIGRAAGMGGWLGLLAALAAAANPLLVYYSQEARMYMLLALLGAGVFWALPGRSDFLGVTPPGSATSGKYHLQEVSYVLAATLGLWTHYSFAIVLAAANGAWLGRWLWLRYARDPRATWRGLGGWIGLNLLPLLLFLPWLPTAINSVRNWPKGGVPVGLAAGLAATLRTLVFGPLRSTPEPPWPWLLAGAALPLAGLLGLIRARLARRFAWPLALWLALPIGLMAGLGLFTDAFLKFLITAAPAWCLLLASVPLLTQRRTLCGGLAAGVAACVLALALLLLPPYYRDANARDNYQGVAAYLAAVGDPQTDLVILDAPGQQEVWRYYDRGLPLLLLPATRPPEAAAVEAALAEATAGRRNVYALFWATDEADPQQLVEGWLDRHAFKSLDTWQGNLRLAAYALADALQPVPLTPAPLGAAIELAGQAQPGNPQTVLPGDAALVQLRWHVLADVAQRLKVSVQLLDAADQVVAQRDGEPVGGSRPTDTWRAGEQILDNYALPLPLGTPPGEYRLLAALYDAQSGQRLQYAGGDAVALGSVFVARPPAPPPAALLPMTQRLEQRLGPVTLLGYDAHRKDFAHAPQTPLAAGDMAHFVFYWQAPDPLPTDWPADLTATVRLGEESVTVPLGGAAYSTGQWQAGEIVRGQLDVPYDGSSAQAVIEVAGESVMLDVPARP
jgi:4-amino-4-deoxy-L-arabinose transferase-like glycosyltransferase